MSNDAAEYTLDVKGLVLWSSLSDNEAGTVKAAVASGRILIFNRAWNEFKQAYDEEAEGLDPDSFSRAKITPEHRAATAALASRAQNKLSNQRWSRQGSDWAVAGAASCEGLTIITDDKQKPFYETLDGCKAVTIQEFLSSTT